MASFRLTPKSITLTDEQRACIARGRDASDGKPWPGKDGGLWEDGDPIVRFAGRKECQAYIDDIVSVYTDIHELYINANEMEGMV